MSATIHYAIWPEGMPDAVRYAEHPGAALTIQTSMALALLVTSGKAVRIRVARSTGDRPDPHEIDPFLAEHGIAHA